MEPETITETATLVYEILDLRLNLKEKKILARIQLSSAARYPLVIFEEECVLELSLTPPLQHTIGPAVDSLITAIEHQIRTGAGWEVKKTVSVEGD